MQTLLRCIFFSLILATSFSQVSLAATNPVLENAQRQLSLLDSSTAENRALREIYLKTIDAFNQIEITEKEIATFKKSLKDLPEKTVKLQKELNSASSKNSSISIKETTLSALELKMTELQSTQLELRQNRNQIDNEIAVYNQNPVALRQELADIKQRLNSESNAKLEEQRQLDDVLFTLNNLKIQAINLKLLVIPLQIEYDRLKLIWTDNELATLDKRIRLYQDTIQQQRKDETDKLLLKSTSDTRDSDPAAVTQLIKLNNKLSQQLRDSVASNATSVQKLRIIEQQLSLLQQSYKVIQQQLQLSENIYGIELKNFSQRFSVPLSENNTAAKLARIRLQNIELNQLKLDLTTNVIDTDSWSKVSINDLDALQTTNQTLINNLHKAYTRELDELSKILTVESQIELQLKQGKTLLAEYLLWLPSVPAINLNWFTDLHNSTLQQIDNANTFIGSIKTRSITQWSHWLAMILLLIGLAGYLAKYQKDHEKKWSLQIGNVVQDRFSRTFRLIILAPLITLPMPFACYVLINKVFIIENQYTLAINNIFVASLWMYLSFMHCLKRPYGLFISHLDLPEEFCVRLKKLLLPLYVIGVPFSWLLLYINQIPSLELHSGLGRLLYVALALLAGSFWAALWKVSPHINTDKHDVAWWQQTKLWLSSLVIIHALLIAAGVLGYLLTGAIIMSLILATTLILFTFFTIYRLGVRWLLIAERRISFDKARSRRNEILAAREKNEDIPPLEEDYLGFKSVSEQAVVLLKALCFGLTSIAMWLLVKNYLPSLDVLDKIILWSNDITTASGVISESISLANVLTSSFIIGVTILAAYNLPGLLELLVLRYMNLTPGTGYAITTITRYILIMVCVLAGASQMGVEWSKLQWLVAAMGVGLGFGLQEIVANFVSGIIILFEKPVRIGDTVTIGGVSGKVTKIKIRATTIADWDRKEVIIPNKTFVTDQLINWSLSDAITRVIVNVGVARGSDTQQVHDLIIKCVNSNPRVLKDPIPEVFFTAFGIHTLDFELRFFVADIGDRNPAINEINQHINQIFTEQNVSIALPQLDVHLHRAKVNETVKPIN